MPHPWDTSAICERCKLYKPDCWVVPYNVPPMLTPPPVEIIVGPDYIREEPVIRWEDVHVPNVLMCAECRAKKVAYASKDF